MEDASQPLPATGSVSAFLRIDSGSPEAVGLTRAQILAHNDNVDDQQSAAFRRGIIDVPADALPASTDGTLPQPARVSRSQLSRDRGQSLRSHLLLPLHFMQRVLLEWQHREITAAGRPVEDLHASL